jgi:1-acyl-sn-glycerol-3-phosphate acyltransferase
MELQRSSFLFKIACHTLPLYMHTRYNARYFGHENIPKEGPVLVLPKHQRYDDIVFEGIFLGQAGRYANWVMKSTWETHPRIKPLLMGVLKGMGGFMVGRGRDLRNKMRAICKKDPDWETKLGLLKEDLRRTTREAFDYIGWLYKQGEVVVMHPEGGLYKGEMGDLKPEFIEFTKKIAKTGLDIPIVPIGIKYSFPDAGEKRRPSMTMRAGKPLSINQEGLLDVVKSEIARLSGIVV